MDIHHSHKHGPFSRMYFLTAILVILLSTAFLLRTTEIFEIKSEDSLSTTNNAPTSKTIDDDSGKNISQEIKLLNEASGTIEDELVSIKEKPWSSSKESYLAIIEKFKAQYPSIANLINTSKNAEKNTTEIEKDFDDLKAKITEGEADYLAGNKTELHKKLDLSLTNLNTLIALISNL